MSTQLHEANYRRELGGGLVLRWSTAADLDGILEVYGTVFRRKEDDTPQGNMLTWLRDIIAGRHPLLGAGDFAVVEDTERGILVAATNLMRQPVDFAGIPMVMGRPEMVATLPDYRNRGLVRAIFELIHARSEARGDTFQGITGIAYYYRQFGYEYASWLGGGRNIAFADIPKLKEGESEPYTLRDATPADLPLLQALYERERTFARRARTGHPAVAPLATTPIPDEYWHWMVAGATQDSGETSKAMLMVDSDGRSVGALWRYPKRWGETLAVRSVMVAPGVALAKVVPALLRGLQAIALELPAFRDDAPPASQLHLQLFEAHPLYDLLPAKAQTDRSYAWYIRVPDLPGFVRQIAPVLERRLAASALDGHSGELRIEFYRGGLRLAFEKGRLVAVEDWRKPVWGNDPQAGFPPLSFLQLVFGYRSLQEMRDAQPDVWADHEAAALLDALFPVQPSWLMPIE